MTEYRLLSWGTVFAIALSGVLAGVGVAAEPKRETFRGWEVRCDGNRDCVAVSVTEGAQFIVATKTDGNEQPNLVIHIPASAKRGDPIALHVESGATFQTRVIGCTEKFCEARIAPEANSTVLTRLLADTKAIVSYRLGENMHVVPFSLVDFRKALEAMRQ